MTNEIKILIQKLVGEAPKGDCVRYDELLFLQEGAEIGYSQFNEILLLLGFDRVTQSFFQFIVDGTTDYNPGSAIKSLEQFEKGVNNFQKLAILQYANIKFGFKELGRNTEELNYQLLTLAKIDPTEFSKRHKPVLKIEIINPDETYLLGYKIQDQIEKALRQNENDPVFKPLYNKMLTVLEKGRRNQIAYLTSDHLDVYIATSMRLKHEFIAVNKAVSQLESDESLTDLSLRMFDPTQAYCKNRIDKGLSEALMLKRAKCTVYLAQESETLGKDSELASTLAQGKPVIALVPSGDKEYVNSQIELYRVAYPELDSSEIVTELLKTYNSSLAWGSDLLGSQIRGFLDDTIQPTEEELLDILYAVAQKHYDDRYNTLVNIHPLGIQVDLETGVATGVLAARDISTCAKLIRSHVLRSVEYEIQKVIEDNKEYTYLKEKISGCIYRVVTGDAVLTNSYWNFYLNEPNG